MHFICVILSDFKIDCEIHDMTLKKTILIKLMFEYANGIFENRRRISHFSTNIIYFSMDSIQYQAGHNTYMIYTTYLQIEFVFNWVQTQYDFHKYFNSNISWLSIGHKHIIIFDID